LQALGDLEAEDADAPSEEVTMSKIKILFLAANPLTTSRLDLEEELHVVEQELRAVKFWEHIELRAHHAVRPDDLLRHVRSDQPTIIHFSGHASPSGIALRTDSGDHQTVSSASLRRFLEGRGVDVVVLNACFTEELAREIATSVRCVIGTSSAVGDEAARRFSCAFYRSLGDGLTVADAFRDGGDAVALHGLTDVFRYVGDVNWRLLGP
jgi:CHAT domain-containing protein